MKKFIQKILSLFKKKDPDLLDQFNEHDVSRGGALFKSKSPTNPAIYPNRRVASEDDQPYLVVMVLVLLTGVAIFVFCYTKPNKDNIKHIFKPAQAASVQKGAQ